MNTKVALTGRTALSVAVASSLLMQPAAAQNRGVGDACQSQRAPLVQLDKEYKDLRRSKLGAAVGEGIKKGATVIASAALSSGGVSGVTRGGFGGGFGGVSGLLGSAVNAGMAQQATRAQGGAQTQATPVAFFGPDVIQGALGLNVPGVGGGSDSVKAYAALGVLVAIVGTIDAYARLKQQEAGGDLTRAAYNIDQDAARQLGVTQSLASNANALADCRTQQLADINTRLAGASNDKDRRAITRERTQYIDALEKDIDLAGGLAEEHTGLAKTFTQGRAMAGGISEAEVLGSQAPAYAPAPSTSRLSMPAAPTQASYTPGAAPAAAPPPAAVTPMAALRATAVRDAPVASSAVLMNLPAGRQVTPKGPASGGWYEIDVAGAAGYVRAADLGAPGAAPPPAPSQQAAAGGRGRAQAQAAPPPPPQLAAASNIRAYNGSVIAARDNGKGRLSSLMTDIQTSQRKAREVYWASLMQRLLG